MEKKVNAKVEDQTKGSSQIQELSLEDIQDVAGGGIVSGDFDVKAGPLPTVDGIVTGDFD